MNLSSNLQKIRFLSVPQIFQTRVGGSQCKILRECHEFRQNPRKVFLREGEQAEGVAAIVGLGRITNDLIGGNGVVRFDDVLQLESPKAVEVVDDRVPDAGNLKVFLNIGAKPRA